ncbi:MAG: MTAP family purine nucleoside phosphorylase [Candidatus Berkelbacteria bacterium]|nr:MTAP family purine nucleoside phosphorylase [Candidatus Berkelbacteria bacterium]
MSSSGLATQKVPKLGIIGGSGLCTFPELGAVERVRPETKYGLPSDDILIGQVAGQAVAFLPRHGSRHDLPPHHVPYLANLTALKEVGVEFVIATCIVGSLKREIPPGSLVTPDQFVNLTWGRDDSFAPGGSFMHLAMGEPYCDTLRRLIAKVAEDIGEVVMPRATVAVIQGPRFSTFAESRWLSSNGWDLVNMTQYPECYFAKELGLCYASIAAVTDYDVGLHESLIIDPANMGPVLKVFRRNVERTKALLLSLAGSYQPEIDCGCARNLVRTYYEQA